MALTNEDVQELLIQQEKSFDHIKQICANFKKDSASRKNLEYLQKRLEALTVHWKEFQERDLELKQSDDKNLDYFINDVYEKTRQMYYDTKESMLRMYHELTDQKPEGKFSPRPGTLQEQLRVEAPPPRAATPRPAPGTSGANDNNTEILLRQQDCNFAVLSRALTKIDLERINEKWELEDHLSILKSKWDAVEKLNLELNFILMGTDFSYEAKYSKWERAYDDMKRNINKKIWSQSHYQKTTPKLEIPEFNGNYNQWINFKDIYLETIHSNPLLNNAQKMQHLKSKLKGDAEKLVQHLNISADNYESCWEMIVHRYDNRRLLFSSYLNTLLNQPNMQHANGYNIKKLHDTTMECLNGLNNIGVDTNSCESIITHILLQKLDPITYGEYIHELHDPRELPILEDFLKFLETKFIALDTIQNKQGLQKQATSSPNKPSTSFYNKNDQRNNYNSKPMNFNRTEKWPKSLHTAIRNCPLCKYEHVLMQCRKFQELSVTKRNAAVRDLQICKNCLYSHEGKQCTSNKVCKVCNKKHHTLLHDYDSHPSSSQNTSSNSSARASHHVKNDEQEVLLTTVQIQVKNSEGNYITLRALLDQGSQVTLITENAAQRLRLPRHKLSAAVSGVGSIIGNSKGQLKLNCKSIHSDYAFVTDALILTKLINNLPNSTLKTHNWDHLSNVKLADPDFYISGPIDLLLGANIYSEIILDGVLKHDTATAPVAQQTKLGWILCGNTKTFNCLVTLNELADLTRFWETEDIPNQMENTTSEDYCERHYVETTKRLETGKYVVKMPLKEDWRTKLGESKPSAIAQFKQLERKMARQDYFAQQYKNFMNEYKELGHMKLATTATKHAEKQVFLPHHGVIRESSTTTKLRVVFNASMKTSTNYSLNDLMEKGPNLQKDIMTLIIKWRSFKYVLTGVIEKMYRNILLTEKQQPLQQIIWRTSSQEHLQEMQLCSLSFGAKAAPYLAMRTLRQLAIDEGDNYPDAKKALLSDFYMDDVITAGHDTAEGTIQLQKQLYELLGKGGFTLRKWASNDPSILQHLTEQQKSNETIFNFKQEEATKTLGIVWNQTEDVFSFNWNLPAEEENIYTKRKLLSYISKLYDPLGWISPTTVLAKLIFQKLWTLGMAWDDTLPTEVIQEWESIKLELINIKNLTIPRWLNCSNKTVELHGFCDASEKAYSCVIYSRAVTDADTGDDVITLLAAKTKVAPLKSKTSLPRLELCGARLLANLLQRVQEALSDHLLSIHCYTDSQVVLAWIKGNKSNWDRYITSRTTYIKSITNTENWRYVKSCENPADCATRGLTPNQLQNYTLWWKGPEWLLNWNPDNGNNSTNSKQFTTEEGEIKNCFATEPDRQKQTNEVVNNLLNKSSDLHHMTRVAAWVLRYKAILRNQTPITQGAELTLIEIKEALNFIIKTVQQEQFEEEIKSLKTSGKISTRSKLFNLTPVFLDENGILRIKGRLQLSALPEETKHPAILPSEGRLTQLVIEQAHRQVLHGGARLTLAQTRQQFWIISGTRTVKKIVRRCVRCHRYKNAKNDQLMGNLPEARITPSRPFTHTGVDFTGHVDVKINKGRGVKTCKGYIAIFICLATKAVHIELVSDLSTETFIAALKRMCARRATPQHMYSDNGKNFVGAARVLREEFAHYSTMRSTEFLNYIEQQQIQWHFNAPLWPSAGGIWEAAVKSCKRILKTVLGEQKLTFEQFSTLLCQVEACLNSRPLSPLTEDPEDLDYLTPGHFLTGSPTMSLPQQELTTRTLDIRNRWKLVELMTQHFWNRWSKECLSQLQLRSKWRSPKENIQQGELVLIKDNLPPGKWAMGRVTEVHPGRDGYTRVVTLKTQNGTLKRPITQLSPLPSQVTEIQTELPQTNPTSTTSLEKRPNNNSDDDKNDDSESSTSTRRRPRRHVKKTFFTIAATLLTLLCVCGSAASSKTTTLTPSIHITPLGDNRPVYYDDIGDIQLIHDEWKLLMYFNLSTYWNGVRETENYIQKLDSVCNSLDPRYCETTIQQLHHELELLKHYNNLLLVPQRHLSGRNKRGLVNGVGYVANSLFGILDQRFADKYQDDIQAVQTNENYLLELIKNQTSITELENLTLKKQESNIRRQFALINKYMNETDFRLARIESEIEIVMAANYFSSTSLTAYLLLSNLKNMQEMLFNALTDIYQGHIDVHLITPDNLITQLTLISGRLPKTLSLPLGNDERDIKNIYKLLYAKARVTGEYFFLEIHIPLTNDEDYSLYRVIPLPMRSFGIHNETTFQVQVSSNYIAVNVRKNTYVSINEDGMKHCIEHSANNYVCNLNLPIQTVENMNAPCEAKLLSHQTISPCTTSKTACTDDWIELHTLNTWLAICCDACTLRTVCDDDVSTHVINTSAILSLKQGCILQTKTLMIHSRNNYNSKARIEYDISYPKLDMTINGIVSTQRTPQLAIPEDDNIRIIQEKLDTLKNNERQLPAEITSHDIHQFALSYLLLAAGIMAAILWIARKRGWCKKRGKVNPTISTKECEGIEMKEMRATSTNVEMTSIELPSAIQHSRTTTRKPFSFDI
ncbi:unnamed protein product [Plutella xylostella]|uniref:(diamondback moth) hypothetical protein n=1 Tax=Plutella xylostella TaxID=51655 RepID=A0A8S4FWE3_PLUXY|nr:unnamed protein product [Plutella xylostella]